MPITLQNPGAAASVGKFTLSPATTGSYTLTFPASDGTADQALTFNTSGVGTWTTVTPPTTTGWTFSLSSTGTNATVNVMSMTPSGGTASQAWCVAQKGGSSSMLVLSVPDGTATGGNARGAGATDLQMGRSSATQVAASFAYILGGYGNTAGASSFILGGYLNLCAITQGSYSAVVGGSNNNVNNTQTAILCGDNNLTGGTAGTTAAQAYSVIVNGRYATTRSQGCTTVWGSCNFNGTTQGAAQIVSHRMYQNLVGSGTGIMACGVNTGYTNNNCIVVAASMTYAFYGYVTCTTTAGANCKTWKVAGLIRRPTAGVPTFVGTPTVTDLYSSAGLTGTTLITVVTNGTDQFAISATSGTVTETRWFGHIWTVEVY